MKKWTIGKRIIAGFAVILLITVIIGSFSYSRLVLIKKSSDALTTDSLPGIIILGQIRSDSLERYGLIEKHILSTSPADMDAAEKRATELTAEISKLYEDYAATIHSPEDQALYEADNVARDTYKNTINAVFALSNANKNQEAFALIVSSVDPAFKKYVAALENHLEWNRKNGIQYGAEITRNISQSLRFTLTGLAAAILLAGAIAFLTIRTVNRRLRTTSDALESGAAQVSAAAAQVSASSQTLAEGASEQAASLEETSASLEELASMTKRNAESAQEAKSISNQTRAAAEAGAGDMDAMKLAMDDIKTSSNDIAKIIKSIDEIAFQTNILALNAAVEAARAGEAGAGFAVVAEEVRNLAQRSALSAKETAAKIEVAISKSDNGVRISGKVAVSLGEILEKARRVDSLVAEIATASSEQNQGLGQVNTAVGQMDKITQANAGSAEEGAAAAEELNAQALVMRENVAELLSLIGGAEAARSVSPSKPEKAAAIAEETRAEPPARPSKTAAMLKPHRQDAHPQKPALAGEGGGFRDI